MPVCPASRSPSAPPKPGHGRRWKKTCPQKQHNMQFFTVSPLLLLLFLHPAISAAHRLQHRDDDKISPLPASDSHLFHFPPPPDLTSLSSFSACQHAYDGCIEVYHNCLGAAQKEKNNDREQNIENACNDWKDNVCEHGINGQCSGLVMSSSSQIPQLGSISPTINVFFLPKP